MDLINRTVAREGAKIELTTKEFALLEFLMRHLDKVVDRNSIARQVWGTDFDPDSNVIDVYINHLRKKIDSPFARKLLKTVVGEVMFFQKLSKLFKGIRFRLALVYSTLFGLFICIFAYILTSQYIQAGRERFDSALLNYAIDLASDIKHNHQGLVTDLSIPAL